MNTTKKTTQGADQKNGQSKGTDKNQKMDKNDQAKGADKNQKMDKNGKSSANGSSDEQSGKTKDELLEMAKKLDITGRHDMSKDELLKAVEQHAKK